MTRRQKSKIARLAVGTVYAIALAIGPAGMLISLANVAHEAFASGQISAHSAIALFNCSFVSAGGTFAALVWDKIA